LIEKPELQENDCSFHWISWWRLKTKYQVPNVSQSFSVVISIQKREEGQPAGLFSFLNCNNNKKLWCLIIGF
jgi:hypothetical protein